MIKFQRSPGVWDFGSPARSARLLAELGFTCTRAGTEAMIYNPASNLYEYAAANSFRFSSECGRGGLLVEDAATNLCLYSSQDHATWASSGSPTKASGTSVITGKNSIKITATTSEYIYQTVGTFSSGTETFAVLVESGDSTTCDIEVYNATTPASIARIRLTFATGAVTTVSGSADASGARVVGVGKNGGTMYMLWMQITGTELESRRVVVWPSPTTNGKFTYLHHAQLTESDVVSSPIVTTTTSVTREQDVISSASVPAFYRQTGMSIVSEFSSCAASGQKAVISLTDGTVGNVALLFLNAGVGSAALIISGATTAESSGVSASDTAQNAIAMSYVSSSITAAMNGTASAGANPAGVPTVSEMSIGSVLGSIYKFSGVIFSIKFIGSTLSGAGLEDIT
jgi:hypothetical protein